MTSLFVGRFQPFHDGHRAIVAQEAAAGNDVVIAVRNTIVSERDPLTYEERVEAIAAACVGLPVQIIRIPDIEAIVYGRTPGYNIRRVFVGDELEAISGTAIRAEGIG